MIFIVCLFLCLRGYCLLVLGGCWFLGFFFFGGGGCFVFCLFVLFWGFLDIIHQKFVWLGLLMCTLIQYLGFMCTFF